MSLADKLSTKEAWDSVASACIGVDRVCRATLQQLRKEWVNLSFRPGEQIEDFALRLATLKQQMILHGERNLDEERAVEKLLRATPKKYTQLKITIETLLDFQDLTIEEVIGRLKTVDDLDDEPVHEPVFVGGKLMLTEEQWLARQNQKKDAGGAGGSASSSGEARRGPRGGKKQKRKLPREEIVTATAAGKEQRQEVPAVTTRPTATTFASTVAAPATRQRIAPSLDASVAEQRTPRRPMMVKRLSSSPTASSSWTRIAMASAPKPTSTSTSPEHTRSSTTAANTCSTAGTSTATPPTTWLDAASCSSTLTLQCTARCGLATRPGWRSKVLARSCSKPRMASITFFTASTSYWRCATPS